MQHRTNTSFLLFLTVTFALHFSSAQLKFDDDPTTRQLHLEDIENEEELRLLQQTQQLPLPPSAGTKLLAPSLLRQLPRSVAEQYRNPFYDVAALTARSPPAVYRDFQRANAQQLRLNLHDSDYNELTAQPQYSDYTANDANDPLLQQYHNGAVNSDGYALKETPSTFVLVPPFGYSDARKPAPYQPALQEQPQQRQQQHHQHQQQQQFTIDPYVPNEPATPAVAVLQLPTGGVQYLTSNDLRELPRASQIYERRPALEYGVPDAQPSSYPTSRRPKLQSNQFAYAPKRLESDTLKQHIIPYPPSFISITTSRPQYADDAVSSTAQLSSFKQADTQLQSLHPVPDFFAFRSPKSLLDSYIPSWVIEEMVQQHRLQLQRNQLASPLKRYFKRELFSAKEKTKHKATTQGVKQKSLTNAKSEKMLMIE